MLSAPTPRDAPQIVQLPMTLSEKVRIATLNHVFASMRTAFGVVASKTRPSAFSIEYRLQLFFIEIAIKLVDTSSRAGAAASTGRLFPIRRLKALLLPDTVTYPPNRAKCGSS